MEDWQERVITERDELATRFTKLQKFILNAAFQQVESVVQGLLLRQGRIMETYIAILSERIKLFKEQ